MVIAVPVLRTSNVNRSDGTNYATEESAHRESTAQRASHRLPAARLLLAPGVKWRETAAPVSGRRTASESNGSPMAHALSNATHTRSAVTRNNPGRYP